jgi:hypothetical protein
MFPSHQSMLVGQKRKFWSYSVLSKKKVWAYRPFYCSCPKARFVNSTIKKIISYILWSLVYALLQCRRVFQSLRCIRSLRLSTKLYQCLQCGSVLSVALLNTVASFCLCLCLWYTTSDSVQTYFLLLCLFCLFTPDIVLPAQLYLKQIGPCWSPDWSTQVTTGLVVYRSATCDGSTTAAIAVTYRASSSLQLHRSIMGGSSKYDARFRRPTIQG